MKTIKTLMAGFLAIGLVGLAHAQTDVKITGSTAFRSAANAQILAIMDPGFTYAYTGATYASAKASIINGTIGGTAVRIRTTWSGSEGGIQTVAGQITVKFIPTTQTTTGGGGTPNVPDPTVAGNANDPQIPDSCFSDTFQSTSLFNGTFNSVTYPTLNSNSANQTAGLPAGQIVGIILFKWIAGRSIPAGMTNMTSQLARNVYGSGGASLALFTGLNADHGTKVFGLGRDIDSGTRLTTFAECGLGAKAVVKQFEPKDGSGTRITTAGGTIATLTTWPLEIVNGVVEPPGNGGYSSGGQLAAAANNTPPANSLVVTYAGTPDANANITNNAGTGDTELAYNGVRLGNGGNPVVDNPTLVTEGAYTFWGYEHVYYRDGTVSAIKSVIDTLALQVFNNAPAPLYSAMQVSRAIDGAVVIQNY